MDPRPQEGRAVVERLAARVKLERQLLRGASWFFLIAAITFLNAILILFLHQDRYYMVGLGSTFLVNALVYIVQGEVGPNLTLQLLALGISGVAAGLFVLFGFFARRRASWAFWVGMVLYALDGLVLLWLEEYFSLLIHGVVLFFLFRGLWALREIRRLERAADPLLQVAEGIRPPEGFPGMGQG